MMYTGSGVNAVATFGHLIAVTRGAMALPDAELEGILAHELGHHLKFHTFVTTAVFWFTLPVIAVVYVISFFRRVLRMLGWFFWLSGLFGLLLVVLWLLGLIAGLLFLSISVQYVLLLLFGRFAEYSADDTAVQLGFGSGLLSALQMMAVVEPVGEPPTLTDRFWASHPPLYKRIRRLEHTVTI
jgi:Zn-dependent protease with chaperone function